MSAIARRSLVLVVLSVFAYLGAAVPSTAQDSGPYWTCRATVGYLGQGPGRIEPFVAHADPTTPCQDADAGNNNPPPLESQQGNAVLQAVYAGTRIEPNVAAPEIQKVDTVGQISSIRLENSDDSFVLTADFMAARVQASCNGGVPGFADSGGVTKAVINGEEVPTDRAYEQAGTGFNGAPLGGVIRVHFNEVVPEGSQSTPTQSLTRRAVRVEILDGNNNPVFTAVLGEAFAGRNGPVCQKAPRCPEGAIYDPTRDVCVIREETKTTGECPQGTTREGDVCVRVVEATTAGPGAPVGGKVVPLGDVAGYRGPCKNPRFGRLVAIIGTARGDRITGSNKSDRIFVFAGNDRVSGGRGNECIEGGEGSDRLDGSTGSDWLLGGPGQDQLVGGQSHDYLYGGAGNDTLQGSSGSDRLYGGAGRNKLDGGKGNDRLYGGPDRDYIIAGNGRDVVRAGKGNDDINVAAAGVPAKVDCGGGVDTLRINNNELRNHRNCERVLVTTRVERLRSYNEAFRRNKRR